MLMKLVRFSSSSAWCVVNPVVSVAEMTTSEAGCRVGLGQSAQEWVSETHQMLF